MITTFFISIALYVVNLILLVFPNSSGFPADFDTAIQTIAGYTTIFSPILPLSTLATIIGLVITFEIAVFGFKALRWGVSHIPFVGGKG